MSNRYAKVNGTRYVPVKFQSGEKVHVYASNHGKILNEQIWQNIIRDHGTGPFMVTGVGPAMLAISLGGRNINIPHAWASKDGRVPIPGR